MTKKRLICVLLFIISAAISIYSYLLLANQTQILEYIEESATKELFIEHFLLFLGFYLILRVVKSKSIIVFTVSFIAGTYLYLHQAATALIIVFIYVKALIWLGEILLLFIRKEYKEESNMTRILNSFVIGSLFYIISVCIMSALHIASIEVLRVYTLLLAALTIVLYLWLRIFKVIEIKPDSVFEEEFVKLRGKNYFCVSTAIMLSALLLQLGRINIALDYDSLRYGLRSLSVLIGNTGIYDKLGTVNDVYVYPKGLEILTLALNNKITFGFVLSFNYICAILMLICVYEIISICTESINKAWLGVVLVSVTPAVMNMSISAKTDMITLLMQLVSVLNICLYIKSKKNFYIIFALTALLASIIYKPTSLLFSFGIGVANLIYLFFDHIFNKDKSERVKDKKSFDISFIYLLSFPLLAIVFVYARTYMLTGHIITSVYSSVWYKLGMETKYPYTIGIYKSGGMNMSSGESVDMIYRLFQLFIAPTKEVHIYIASPTVLIAVLAGVSIILFVRFLFKKNNNKEIFAYIAVLLAADALVSLISLFILNQIDGNYFILLFTLIITATCFLVERDFLKYLFRGLLPCIVFAFFITGLTNWAGVRGLSKTINDGSTFGIYNHHNKFLDRDLKERKEFADAYEDLKELGNPRTLLLSDDDSLSALGLDIRTYTDITGSGGNPAVVKTLDHFKRYLDYAQIKYICVDKEYLKDRQRASDVVKYMYEEGSTKIYKKYGDVVIYKVDVKQN